MSNYSIHDNVLNINENHYSRALIDDMNTTVAESAL